VGSTVIAGLIVGAQHDDDGPVDVMVVNGRVYTADGEGTTAEAVAIQGNKILRVGSTREIQRLRRPQTIVIDAKGGTVMPGLTGSSDQLLESADEAEEPAPLESHPAPRDRELSMLRRAVAEAHRRGITSVHTSGGTPEDLELFDRLRRENEMALRVYGAIEVAPDVSEADLDALDELRARFPDDPLLKAGAIEVPIEGDQVTEASLVRLVTELDKRDWQIILEAHDDRAVDLALAAYSHALTSNPAPERGRRHRIEVVDLVGPVNYGPFEELGVVHTPPLEPVSIEDAIDSLTRDAAWVSFDDHRKGSIARDMLADVVVFSTDILGRPAAELDDAEVSVTIFDGKVVFRKSGATDN
jgi:predicted amidohydrolase YtcJ